jgi:hypothetical protein
MKIEESGSRSRSISQRHGSATQHCIVQHVFSPIKLKIFPLISLSCYPLISCMVTSRIELKVVFYLLILSLLRTLSCYFFLTFFGLAFRHGIPLSLFLHLVLLPPYGCMALFRPLTPRIGTYTNKYQVLTTSRY